MGNLAKRGGLYLTWNCCSFTKREATPNCTLGACNPVNFTTFNLNKTGWEIGRKFDILILKKKNQKKPDPGYFATFSTHHDHS
jgi:hypothetical protein